MAAESDLETWCRDYAGQHGCFLLKWVSPGTKGVPDRILIGEAFVVFLEFKAPRGRLSPQQKRWRMNLRAMRQSYSVIDSREQFMKVISTEGGCCR